jgi:hypothetical protein
VKWVISHCPHHLLLCCPRQHTVLPTPHPRFPIPRNLPLHNHNRPEYQEKLKALEAQKTEAENLEIVQMVRALRMTPTQLSAMLSGGTVPGSLADDNNEQEENSYEE